MRRGQLVRLAAAIAALNLLVASGALAGGRPLEAVLTGAAEVSGGDPDGSGTADLTLNQGQGEVCFTIEYSDIVTPHAAHIHKAPAGANGPVVVGLFTSPTASPAVGCISGVDKSLVKDIRKNPADYYVNVHNSEFPAGALRGQLSK